MSFKRGWIEYKPVTEIFIDIDKYSQINMDEIIKPLFVNAKNYDEFEYCKTINIKPNGDYDYAEEYETIISNADELNKILNFLDFKKIITVDKQREYYKLKTGVTSVYKTVTIVFNIKPK